MPTSPSSKPSVLTSWKDIATYMGKGVRTVQRWEQEAGLPVRRARSHDKKAVLAIPQEIDAWVAKRTGIGPSKEHDGATSPRELQARLDAQIVAARVLTKSAGELRRSACELRDGVHSSLALLTERIARMSGQQRGPAPKSIFDKVA
ncbi:MAG: hypothetical protein ACLGXA_08210 [Acidobacteriota bacterium]